MNTVSEHWLDDWLRANWDVNQNVTEHAYQLGIITPREYVDATRSTFRADLDELIASTVADTLTADEALLVIASAEQLT